MVANATFWNRAAKKYAAQPLSNPDAFERKIAITKALMTPDDVVLDIGCGTGSLAVRLAETGAQVHGLDLSEGMIEFARGKSVENTTFHVGPFDDSFQVFGPGTLDGLTAYSILHLVEDPAAALARVYGLLKPGGFFVSSTVVLADSWVPFGLVIGALRLVGKAPDTVHRWRARDLAELIRAAGFEDVEPHEVGSGKMVSFVTARKPKT